jgi:hypothetical protein
VEEEESRRQSSVSRRLQLGRARARNHHGNQTLGAVTYQRFAASAALLLAVGLSVISCGSSKPVGSSATTTPQSALKASSAQQNQYFQDVSRTVPALSSYVQQQGKVALDAILTYGSGFCVFLQDGDTPAEALVAVAAGAQKIESSTHFPASTTTFESIASAALLTLCPSEQTSLSAAEQTQLRQISKELGAEEP